VNLGIARHAWGVLVALLIGASAHAAYPEKPIRLLVGFAAGGPADVSARMIAERLTESLKQPVIVENRPGSNGSLAVQSLMAAPPDGYTLLLGTTGTLTIAPAVMKKLPYDTLQDLTPVASVISYAYLLVARNDLPVKTIADFIQHARQNPGKLTYTSPGIGTVNHLGTERFAMMSDLRLVHVPYKGDSEALIDVMGGHVDAGFISFSLTAQQAKAGKLRALAITTPTRSPIVPEVPTVREATGLDFDLLPWTGILAPRGTPPAVVATLHAAVNDGLRHPDVQKRIADLGYVAMIQTTDDFRRLIETELGRWREVAQRVNVNLD